MTARRFTLKDLVVNEQPGQGQDSCCCVGWFLQPLLAYVSQASLVISRKGCNRATPALFTSRSTGPTLLRARSVASQSARSTHTGSTPGHCVYWGKAKPLATVSQEGSAAGLFFLRKGSWLVWESWAWKGAFNWKGQGSLPQQQIRRRNLELRDTATPPGISFPLRPAFLDLGLLSRGHCIFFQTQVARISRWSPDSLRRSRI